ncbi:MAG TPA: M20/M25/M40 family metallo-hydrolase [Terriglobia bacterium]|nr:M20/M25/M40 family metallo-hydrolase [Terriglobia bacterium]
MKIASRLALICVFAFASRALAQDPHAVVDRVSNHSAVKNAQQFIETDHDRLIREIISITEIPAPPFKEADRARAFAQMMRDSGLTNVEIDPEGNVLGLRRGTGNGPLVAIAAHLDTVFPEGTDVRVKRDGNRLTGPGVGDNSRSLAVLLVIMRAMESASVQTTGDILFVGDVGEEGPGDLRGMRYLFQKGKYKDRIRMFISVDGAGSGSDIVTGALGSRRYHVTFRGPGGHSYGAFGLVNPSYALAKAMDRLSKISVPTMPRTTYNVGVIGGGTSVNSIPNEVWMDVDLRSESPQQLNKLAEEFIRQMRSAADDENRTRSVAQGRIEVEAKVIGERPSGSTSVDSQIVKLASAAAQKFGLFPTYSVGSTDSNIPISLGVPAITLDSGGTGGRAHALDEWINVEKNSSVRGINLVLTTLLALSGVQ